MMGGPNDSYVRLGALPEPHLPEEGTGDRLSLPTRALLILAISMECAKAEKTMTDYPTDFPGGRLTIRYIPISIAKDWEWFENPKRHNFDELAQSILTHGFRDAPIYDEALDPPGIVAGNGRIKTAYELYLNSDCEAPPPGIGIIKQEGTFKGEWAVPIQFGINSESRLAAKAFAVDHNNLAIVGFSDEEIALIWKPEAYARMLARLKKEGAPIVSINEQTVERLETGGFLKDVQALVSDRAEKVPSPVPQGEDNPPSFGLADELFVKWKPELGQVWKLGVHRLAVGDCRDRKLMLALMGRKKATLALLDPPYGMGKEADGIENDNIYSERLDAFIMECWRASRRHLVDNASAYIFGNPEDLWRLWYLGGLKASERMTLRNEIVWDKAIEGINPTMKVAGVPFKAQRMYFPTERALFFMIGEQGFNINSENYWEGWEPIRSYLAAEVEKMGWKPKDIKRITGVGMFSHWFTESQWTFIPEAHFLALQKAAAGKAFVDEHRQLDAHYRGLRDGYEVLKAEFYKTRAYFDNTHSTMTDVFRFGKVEADDRLGHPTPKSLELIERMILSSSAQGDVVIAPFLGSGTDLIGCERLKRKCRAVEINPKWAAISLERWAVLTGKTPVLKG